MNKKPNLFEISTKELSQDAFFTWLLHWASPGNRQYDEKLNACAVDFVKFLANKDLEITKAETNRQWKNIDICVDVNDKYLIIIEDKTFTGEHSNQLERYKKDAEDWCRENGRELICIYLKTGTESKSSIYNVESKGFRHINRCDLINFFKNHSDIENNIYVDFIERITNLEAAEKAFETAKIKEWNWECWMGFYSYLDSVLGIVGWEYVPNPAGGFLGLWWHFLNWKECSVYLQIEEGDLCFRIGPVEKDRGNAREEWHNILMAKAREDNRSEIMKPNRFGSGLWMTVARVERKNWLGDDDEVLDKQKVVEKLKEYEHFLEKCLVNNGGST
jgi:hypothetical protein